MTKKVRKFIGDDTAYVCWNVDEDFEVEFKISDGNKSIRFVEWGRDKKSMAKHSKFLASLIDELLAYREAIEKKGTK